MKLVSSTVLVGVLSLLSAATPGVEAANRHAGTRRQLDLQDGQTGGQLQKRVPLAPRELPPLQVGPKFRMARRSSTSAGTGNVKRAPLAKAEPAAHAGFGAVPMMNIGTAPIVGSGSRTPYCEKLLAHRLMFAARLQWSTNAAI